MEKNITRNVSLGFNLYPSNIQMIGFKKIRGENEISSPIFHGILITCERSFDDAFQSHLVKKQEVS